mmetsp:Transcript_149/g.317  ORF Transcript_149/g.317 Transcript_149/m.317 type:complete len:99 (-) Transcript_149:88-384(-)
MDPSEPNDESKGNERRTTDRLFWATPLTPPSFLSLLGSFLRQPMGKWLEDGTCAPSGRARGKADLFNLALPRPDIEADIAAIQHEANEPRERKTSRRK